MEPSMTIRRKALALALCGAFVAGGASAAPGDRQFVAIGNHDPAALLRAVRAGVDFVRGGRGREFRIILSALGVVSVIPGQSTIQRELMTLRQRAPGLQIIACRETMDALSKANRRRVPTIPGISVQSCAGMRNKMTVAGWQNAPGI
jgi:hypothetical protein